MAARIPGPDDVPLANVRNTRRVVQPAVRQDGANLARIGQATSEILGRARDQQIENEVAQAATRTRRQLDELRATFDEDPDHATYEARFEEQSRAIVSGNAERLTSPAHQRLWQSSIDPILERERQGIAQLAQRRTVEQARAGLLEVVGEAQETLVNEDATPEARREAMATIETMTRRAAERRILTADDAQRAVNQARGQAAEFERTIGLRRQSQLEADRIWAESGGDAAVALEMVRELDGTIRDMTDDRVRGFISNGEIAQRETLESAMERANSLIETTSSLDGLSAAERDIINRSGNMDNLRTYLAARRGGVGSAEYVMMQRQSNMAADTVLADAVDNPEAFVDLDVNGLGLMPDDRLRVRTEQERVRRGEAPGAEATMITRAYELLRSYAEPVARAQGVEMSDREEDRERTNRFRGFLMREARDFIAENNRLPTQSDIEQITSLALTRSTRSNMRAFESRTERGRNLFGPTEHSRAVLVPFTRIPEYQRNRGARAIAQQGIRGLTQEQLQRAIEQWYADELARGAE